MRALQCQTPYTGALARRSAAIPEPIRSPQAQRAADRDDSARASAQDCRSEATILASSLPGHRGRAP